METDEKALKDDVVKAASDYVTAVSIGLDRERIVKRYWDLHAMLVVLGQWQMVNPEITEERIIGA